MADEHLDLLKPVRNKFLNGLNKELKKIEDELEFYQTEGKINEYYCPIRIASWIGVERSELEKNNRKLTKLLKRRLYSAYCELTDFCKERMKHLRSK